jgi:hypothetical protein
MKRLLSTVFAAVLLLGLVALAVLARPNGATPTAPARADSPVTGQDADPASKVRPAPQLPARTSATQNWNEIAIPLSNTTSLPDAQALANAITGTQQLLHWDATAQTFEFYIPDPIFPGGFGTNFNIVLGEAYMVLVDNSAPTVFSLVGDVPPQSGNPGAVQFNLKGGAPCKWNHISLPLDKGSITNAQQLADTIGDVEQLLSWNATAQTFEFYIPDPVFPGGFGTNFTTKIGYPYFVCMTAAKIWP